MLLTAWVQSCVNKLDISLSIIGDSGGIIGEHCLQTGDSSMFALT